MQVFLVGGAVRDELLGLDVVDRDWVVVGSSPEEMVQLGFTPVGKDFPVFLHPKTHEEYALARTERKSAPGYHGFTFHASPDVTLIEDLARRDLTINAMAKTAEGELIDPFGGEKDLKAQVFRHVSNAFQEDPVRVLRLARFAARFPEFTVSDETLQLAQTMAKQGEIQALVPERVWAEVAKGLMEKKPSRLFEVLMACEAFKILWPQWSSLEDDPVSKEWFMDRLNKAAKNESSLEIRFGLCFYPVPSHVLLTKDVQRMCDTFKAPANCKELATLIHQLGNRVMEVAIIEPGVALELIESMDGFRRPERFQSGLSACTIAATTSKDIRSLSHLKGLSAALECTLHLDSQALSAQALAIGLKGPEIGQYLHDERLKALENAFTPPSVLDRQDAKNTGL